jgi:hypothetical protein
LIERRPNATNDIRHDVPHDQVASAADYGFVEEAIQEADAEDERYNFAKDRLESRTLTKGDVARVIALQNNP